ncbi:MAG: phosphoglycerate mutase, partial [Phycisphaerae bacterium]
MKYAIILPDGAADEPLAQLGGRTPLEAANIPNIDWVSTHGRLGLVVTVPAGYTPGTDVATLSLLGYDPDVYYSGRAPIEAAAQGLTAGPDELIFRCNFVRISDGLMKDFTAGHIPQAETDRLIADLNRLFVNDPCVFY